MEQVGYKLIDDVGNVLNQWGGVWGQCPATPTLIRLPNGDDVHCPEVDTLYDNVKLVAWMMDQPADPTAPSLTELQAQVQALLAQIDAALSNGSSNP